MKSIVKSELYKQKVNGIFRLYVIIMFLVGIGSALSYEFSYGFGEADFFLIYNNLLSNSLMLNMIIATVSVYYYIRDFSDKSIQHMTVLGRNRKDIVMAKYIVFNIGNVIAFIIYLFSGTIVSLIFSGVDINADYKVNILLYIFISLILKILYIMAFSSLCMVFCYIVRGTAAYILVILALWMSFLGVVGQIQEVKDSAVLSKLVSAILMVQDQIMFTDRMTSRIYNITAPEVFKFVVVMIVTIGLAYAGAVCIMKRVEIR